MVLLPLLYLALIAFTAWAVILHLKNDTWIFEDPSGHGGFSRFLLYLGPAVAGGILVFFLVKPFFAAKARKPENATSPSEQETAARFALEETTAAILDRLAKLDPFMAALRRRVRLALRLAQAGRSVLSSEDISGIQERLQQFTYPFPHARGRLTVAEYARSEEPAEFALQRVYLDGNSHVDRLFALHYRLIGRILAVADAGEKSLEKQ